MMCQTPPQLKAALGTLGRALSYASRKMEIKLLSALINTVLALAEQVKPLCVFVGGGMCVCVGGMCVCAYDTFPPDRLTRTLFSFHTPIYPYQYTYTSITPVHP
jgi:hypothetical protein